MQHDENPFCVFISDLIYVRIYLEALPRERECIYFAFSVYMILELPVCGVHSYLPQALLSR